jgi:hypothetical protein
MIEFGPVGGEKQRVEVVDKMLGTQNPATFIVARVQRWALPLKCRSQSDNFAAEKVMHKVRSREIQQVHLLEQRRRLH